MPLEIKDLAGLSTPLTKLLDMIASTTEVVFEPTRIKRKAEADAAALLISTNATIQAEALKNSAAARFVAEQLQKQQNLESVLTSTVAHLDATETPVQPVNGDWLRRYMLEVQDVSDSTLQELWARLLSGEIKTPGSYSRRVLRILKDLDPADTTVITKACRHVLHIVDFDGSTSPILMLRIEEQWSGGSNTEPNEIFDGDPHGVQLLQELHILGTDERWWEFSVEGGMSDMHLSRYSAKRVFNAAGSIDPTHLQLALVKQEGPTHRNGQLLLNVWTKRVRICGYQVTSAGEQLFRLSGAGSCSTYLGEVRAGLAATGLVMNP